MPAARRQSKLFGPNGQPVSYFLYPSPRFNLRSHRPRFWLGSDTKTNVSEYDRWEMVNHSRQLFAQIDALSSAVIQKNNWAFGDAWDAHYCGEIPAWGDAVEDWLNNVWMPNANVRGPQYGFKRSMLLSGFSWDVDGDDAMALVESAGGFPQVAFYPSTKIASYGAGRMSPQGQAPGGVIQGGEFDGAKLFDGIILDRNSRAIGLRIVAEDGTFEDISSYNIDLAYEPVWADQARGIPRIATSLLRWMSLQDIDEFIQRGMQRAASIGLIQKTEEGEAALGNEVITQEEDTAAPTGSGAKVNYEEIEGGEMYYLSSAGNESIEGLTYKNPHPNTEAFIERLTRGCLASVGWFIELLDLSSTGRAPTRVLCEMANQSIWSRQRTGYRRWRRAISYAVCKAMKTGAIPRNNDTVDALSWEPGLPKPLSVDAGNDAQADREALKLGLSTKAIIYQKWHGMHYRSGDRQRAKELRETLAEAEAISSEHNWLSKDRALELLEQRSPNPVSTRITETAAAAPANKAKV
jgi:hypothetical protein